MFKRPPEMPESYELLLFGLFNDIVLKLTPALPPKKKLPLPVKTGDLEGHRTELNTGAETRKIPVPNWNRIPVAQPLVTLLAHCYKVQL
jgi:hypothetical protein